MRMVGALIDADNMYLQQLCQEDDGGRPPVHAPDGRRALFFNYCVRVSHMRWVVSQLLFADKFMRLGGRSAPYTIW